MREQILENFRKKFGTEGGEPRIFFSPGRVNLIGEHIDYNGGLVLPCALSLGTYGAIRKRNDNMVKLFSGNFETFAEFSTDELVRDPAHKWGNYPKGVLATLKEAGYKVGGFDMYILGNLPSGAGLSSSACLNTLVATALSALFDLNIDPIKIAQLCQHAEKFNGVNCGIMDPFACAIGKKDHAILLNCNNLKYEHIPLNLGDYRILIANTNHRRGLADSKYNERRAQCEAALSDLQKVCDISELCELSPEDFDMNKGAITEETHRKRAEHAVHENQRTKDAANSLKQGELQQLWDLTVASHMSLDELYDVVGNALRAMFEASYAYAMLHKDTSRVLGTRMTGAGFGGCTVSIIHKDYIDDFIKTVGDKYYACTGVKPSFYIAETSDGTSEI